MKGYTGHLSTSTHGESKHARALTRRATPIYEAKCFLDVPRATADAFIESLSKDTEVHASPPELEGLRGSANLRVEAPWRDVEHALLTWWHPRSSFLASTSAIPHWSASCRHTGKSFQHE